MEKYFTNSVTNTLLNSYNLKRLYANIFILPHSYF
jgi:hypothetical protein